MARTSPCGGFVDPKRRRRPSRSTTPWEHGNPPPLDRASIMAAVPIRTSRDLAGRRKKRLRKTSSTPSSSPSRHFGPQVSTASTPGALVAKSSNKLATSDVHGARLVEASEGKLLMPAISQEGLNVGARTPSKCAT